MRLVEHEGELLGIPGAIMAVLPGTVIIHTHAVSMGLAAMSVPRRASTGKV